MPGQALKDTAGLLDKGKSINYLREKVKGLVNNGCVASTLLARSTAGKPPIVYFLTAKGHTAITKSQHLATPIPLQAGQRQHLFLEHTLAVNDILIAATKLPSIQPAITLLDLKHERTLKTSPITVAPGRQLVPDGFLLFRAQAPFGVGDDIGICLEIDRNTEGREKIQEKLRNYLAFAAGPYQQIFGLNSLTIAFCVTEGGDQRANELLTWAAQILTTSSDLFLFTALPPDILPERLFLDRVFASPGDLAMHALVEKHG